MVENRCLAFGESALIGQTPAAFAGEVARALRLVKRLPVLTTRWREGSDWSNDCVMNGDLTSNKRFTIGKSNGDPLVTLLLECVF